MDEDRPKYGSNPYPVHVRVNIYVTPSLYGTLLLVHLVLAILPILHPPNQSNAARKQSANSGHVSWATQEILLFVCLSLFVRYNIHITILHIGLQSMNDNDAIISYYEDDLKRYERNGTFSLHYFELV